MGNRGFTLLETLVVISILVVLLMMTVFMTMDSFHGYSSRSQRDEVVMLLQRARSHAQNNIYQTKWGVCADLAAQQYVLFEGSYVASAARNEYTSMSLGVTVVSLPPTFLCTSGGQIFTQLSATTSNTAIVLTQTGRTATISINNEGAINW